jgi:hypothetical protein
MIGCRDRPQKTSALRFFYSAERMPELRTFFKFIVISTEGRYLFKAVYGSRFLTLFEMTEQVCAFTKGS